MRPRQAAGSRRALRVASVAAAALMVGLIGTAAPSTAAEAGDPPSMTVDFFSFQETSVLYLSVDLVTGLSGDQPPPSAAAVEIRLPAGYRLDLAGAPGASVGRLLALLAGATDGSGGTFGNADIVVDDPAVYASDPVAQACAPGTHTAVWRATVGIIGQQIALPIAVDALGGDPANGYTIRYCPLRAPSPTLTTGVSFLQTTMFFDDLATGPSTPATYTWSAIVTPASAGTFAPDASRSYEIRALLPVPQTLTLTAQYDAKAHAAVLAGRITDGGVPRAGARVRLTGSNSRGDDDFSLGSVRTDADGRFTYRRHVDKTTRFGASVAEEPRACTQPSTSPAGCVSETLSAPSGRYATAVVPRSSDPTLVPNARDQALARRSVLGKSDLPKDWVAADSVVTPCESFAPDLHTLRMTGQAFSTYFVAPSSMTVAVASRSDVYATKADATAAFAGFARPAAAKCEAEDGGPSTKVLKVGSITAPHVGDASRAFRATVKTEDGVVLVDTVFVRKGRTMLELEVYSLGFRQNGLEQQLARALTARAR